MQVFDSWVGALSPADYREFVLPHSRRIFDIVRPTGVPTIHFGTGTATLLDAMAEAGGDVVGADWRIPLDEAWERIGAERAIQGNLDPTLLLGPRERLLDGADDVLRRAAGRPGHIFNLGHGILPGTPVEHVEALAESRARLCRLGRSSRSNRCEPAKPASARDDCDVRCSPVDGARDARVARPDAGLPRHGCAAAGRRPRS